MNVFKLVGGNYNYYPNTAVELCVISYGDTPTIAPAVSANTDLSVVWGQRNACQESPACRTA